jgi:hypothetical protein
VDGFSVGEAPGVAAGAPPSGGPAPVAGGGAGWFWADGEGDRAASGGAVSASNELPKTVMTPMAVNPTRPTATTELVLTGTAGSIQSHR